MRHLINHRIARWQQREAELNEVRSQHVLLSIIRADGTVEHYADCPRSAR